MGMDGFGAGSTPLAGVPMGAYTTARANQANTDINIQTWCFFNFACCFHGAVQEGRAALVLFVGER